MSIRAPNPMVRRDISVPSIVVFRVVRVVRVIRPVGVIWVGFSFFTTCQLDSRFSESCTSSLNLSVWGCQVRTTCQLDRNPSVKFFLTWVCGDVKFEQLVNLAAYFQNPSTKYSQLECVGMSSSNNLGATCQLGSLFSEPLGQVHLLECVGMSSSNEKTIWE